MCMNLAIHYVHVHVVSAIHMHVRIYVVNLINSVGTMYFHVHVYVHVHCIIATTELLEVSSSSPTDLRMARPLYTMHVQC